MIENRDIKQYVGRALTIVGLFTLTGCGTVVANSGENHPNADASPSITNTAIKGNGYEIRRLARSTFLVTGSRHDKAINYISTRCEILSIDPWTLNSGGAYIIERAVTVENGNCISELTK